MAAAVGGGWSTHWRASPPRDRPDSRPGKTTSHEPLTTYEGAERVPRLAATMLDVAARHNVAPQTEHFPMSQMNEAFDRLEAGKTRYRNVPDADF
jgi:hypothetical protein